jgi:hypothetical protein
VSGSIELARLELAKWDARVAQDRAALAVAERDAASIRARLVDSLLTAERLRVAVQRWDAVQANHGRPNGPRGKPPEGSA